MLRKKKSIWILAHCLFAGLDSNFLVPYLQVLCICFVVNSKVKKSTKKPTLCNNIEVHKTTLFHVFQKHLLGADYGVDIHQELKDG